MITGSSLCRQATDLKFPYHYKELIHAGSFSIEDKDQQQEEIPVKKEVSSSEG